MQLEFAGDAAVMAESDTGRYSVALRSLPSELPVQGNNRVELTIWGDPAEDADDLDVRIVPFMPAMGHGSGSEPWGRAVGNGVYEFEDVHITMPGRWELRTFITSDTTDHASVAFDVR